MHDEFKSYSITKTPKTFIPRFSYPHVTFNLQKQPENFPLSYVIIYDTRDWEKKLYNMYVCMCVQEVLVPMSNEAKHL